MSLFQRFFYGPPATARASGNQHYPGPSSSYNNDPVTGSPQLFVPLVEQSPLPYTPAAGGDGGGYYNNNIQQAGGMPAMYPHQQQQQQQQEQYKANKTDDTLGALDLLSGL